MKPNGRWNKEDMTPHAGVWAVIEGKKPGQVLLQKHVKLQGWTIPVGKASLDENPAEVMKRELKEEAGIDVKEMHLLKKTVLTHKRDDQPVTMPIYMYKVTKYEGEPQNLEPHKHTEQGFFDPHKLVLSGEPVTDALKFWLKHKRKK